MVFKLNPESEVDYRVKLAERYLIDSEDSYKRGDFRGTVALSQLAAGNVAKAVIAVYRILSWSRDPSHELRELLELMPENLRDSVMFYVYF